MEELIKLCKLAMYGNEQKERDSAISTLGLEELTFPEINVRNGENTTLGMLKKHFDIATHINVASRLLMLNTLEEGCEILLRILDYVAVKKMKTRLTCSVEIERLLKYIEKLTKSRKDFFTSIQETKAASDIEEFEEIIKSARKGDKSSKAMLGLNLNLNLSVKEMEGVPKPTRLKLMFQVSKTFCLVGMKTEDDHIAKINGCIMEYLEWFQKECYPKQNDLCDRKYNGEDLCDTFLLELRDREKFHDFVQSKLRESRLKHNEEVCTELEEIIKDPNYEPQSELPSQSESESEENQMAQNKKKGKNTVGMKRKHEEEEADKHTEEEEKKEQNKKPRMKRKHEEEEADKHTEEEEKKEQKKKRKSIKKKTTNKKTAQEGDTLRRHYTQRKCPLCKKVVCNLTRHITKLHVEKNEKIPTTRVKALVEMARHGNTTKGGKVIMKNKEGTSKEYFRQKEICPKCDSVCIYLTTHLQRVHKMDPKSEEYNRVLQMARRYQGKTVELMWDETYINRKKNRQDPRTSKGKTNPNPKNKSGKKTLQRRDDDSSGKMSQKSCRKTPLEILAESLSSTTSDEDFPDPSETTMLPGTPQKAKRSVMSLTLTKNGDDHDGADDNESGGDNERGNGDDHNDVVDDGGEDEKSDEDYDEDEDEQSESEGETEDEKQQYVTWKKYYEEGSGKTTMEKLLILYCRHLQDILGGCKKQRQAIHHTQNVRHVWKCINAEDESLSCFVKDGGLDIWRKWAKPLLDQKKKRPGTIRASLTSLVKFFDFILDYTENKVEGMPEIENDTLERCQRLIKRLVAMGSSVNQLYGHEKWEQILEDQVNAINPEDTNEMVHTEHAKNAIRFLMKSNEAKLSKKEFFAVRDFLIARIGLENGQRPGPLETARIHDFKRIKKQGEKYIMYVTRHKGSRGGPAPLTMTENLKSNLEVFIANVRDDFVQPGVDAIFTTNKGLAFDSGTIGKIIPRWWEKAKGKKGVTSTKLRKMHASQLQNVGDTAKRNAHRLMCHTGRTAETYYMINKLDQAAVEGHDVLAKNINLKDTMKTTLNQKDESDTDFTQEQIDDIDLLFADYINKNAPLSIKETKNIMSESAQLIDSVDDEMKVKKVYFRVKYLQKREFKGNLERITTEDKPSSTAKWIDDLKSSQGSTRRREWSSQDEEVIEERFRKKFQKCPIKSVIRSLFFQHEDLQEMRERNGMTRCYEKVKNMFKRWKVV